MNKKVQRNDPCPCGSGKKYKQCCMKNEQKPVKTYTAEGKRKFKAKLLSNSGAVGAALFGQSATHAAQAQDPSIIEKKRLNKTQENYQVESVQSDETELSEKKAPPKIKKIPSHKPGETFKPTEEDFTK